jgi:hypothetical protein
LNSAFTRAIHASCLQRPAHRAAVAKGQDKVVVPTQTKGKLTKKQPVVAPSTFAAMPEFAVAAPLSEAPSALPAPPVPLSPSSHAALLAKISGGAVFDLRPSDAASAFFTPSESASELSPSMAMDTSFDSP